MNAINQRTFLSLNPKALSKSKDDSDLNKKINNCHYDPEVPSQDPSLTRVDTLFMTEQNFIDPQ